MTDINKCREMDDNREMDKLDRPDNRKCHFCLKTGNIRDDQTDAGDDICEDCYKDIVIQNIHDAIDFEYNMLKLTKTNQQTAFVNYKIEIYKELLRIE